MKDEQLELGATVAKVLDVLKKQKKLDVGESYKFQISFTVNEENYTLAYMKLIKESE